ncbi:MAG TPA: hypothetical protein VFT89_07470 [Rhizobiaceae bacterium]|nr:hypothetical protein [Rhizobiaceae bacterium]
MSSAAAETAGFVRRMLEYEGRGWGDQTEALKRLARECRLSFWTLNNLRIGRAKTVSADVRDRIRAAFIKNCREHAARLIHEAEAAEKAGRGNDALASIKDEIRALAARLEAAQGDQAKP